MRDIFFFWEMPFRLLCYKRFYVNKVLVICSEFYKTFSSWLFNAYKSVCTGVETRPSLTRVKAPNACIIDFAVLWFATAYYFRQAMNLSFIDAYMYLQDGNLYIFTELHEFKEGISTLEYVCFWHLQILFKNSPLQ